MLDCSIYSKEWIYSLLSKCASYPEIERLPLQGIHTVGTSLWSSLELFVIFPFSRAEPFGPGTFSEEWLANRWKQAVQTLTGVKNCSLGIVMVWSEQSAQNILPHDLGDL